MSPTHCRLLLAKPVRTASVATPADSFPNLRLMGGSLNLPLTPSASERFRFLLWAWPVPPKSAIHQRAMRLQRTSIKMLRQYLRRQVSSLLASSLTILAYFPRPLTTTTPINPWAPTDSRESSGDIAKPTTWIFAMPTDLLTGTRT